MPSLVVIKGSNVGKTFELKPGKVFKIGRRGDNDFSLPDSALSRYHCEIAFDGKTARLMDKESRHGTYVNGKQVRDAKLSDEDEIVLGQTTLQFKAAAEPAKPVDSEEDQPTRAEGQASGEPHAEPLATDRHKRNWITVAAVGGVAIVVCWVAFLLVRHFKAPEAPSLVPMDQLPEVRIQLLRSRKLLERPPTYIIDVEIENRSDKPQFIRLKDFQVVDTSGLTYAALNPTGKSDLKDATLDPGGAVKGSLNYELGMGAAISKLVFQGRGFLPVQE